MLSNLLHLRLPFSWILAPVFFFACAQWEVEITPTWWLAFFIPHFLLYPASHSFNSFFDKDTSSIGGLENPPPVMPSLLLTSLVMDFLAIIMGSFFVSWTYGAMVFFYGAVSKAYSHPEVRLKKHPYLSTAVAALMQGGFSYAMATEAISPMPFPLLQSIADPYFFWGLLICTLWIGALYPFTQIYQHESDKARGDRSLSLVLGVRGTLVWTAVGFVFALFAMLVFAAGNSRWDLFVAFVLASIPSAMAFVSCAKVFLVSGPHYRGCMRVIWVSATTLNLFLLIDWWIRLMVD